MTPETLADLIHGVEPVDHGGRRRVRCRCRPGAAVASVSDPRSDSLFGPVPLPPERCQCSACQGRPTPATALGRGQDRARHAAWLERLKALSAENDTSHR